MKLKELLEKLGIHLDECTSNEQIGEYEILFAKLKKDFNYEYLPLKIRRIDSELETIILEQENL